MGRSHSCLLAILIVFVALIAPASGQTGRAQPTRVPGEFPSQAGSDRASSFAVRSERARFIPGLRERPAFPEMVRAAGMIFSATVKAVERRLAGDGQSVGTVVVTLHVERAIRGATPGEDLTISEWIGLWAGGQRYRIGERVLLFLYPRSKLGLTSWVGGALGRFNVDAWGRVMLSAQHLRAFEKDPVVGGRSRVAFSDLALAVRHAGEEE